MKTEGLGSNPSALTKINNYGKDEINEAIGKRNVSK